ncbi:hypothetical protein ACJDUG_15340 [Clostridium sp. WILCCON 0185]|uniref:Uncharacterized protein n=1 Tax=Candidatus Clostridium stratigraminis TaxID=3381661 RepID=A0ABW8T6Y9_9CLOT
MRVYVKLSSGRSFKVPAPIGFVKAMLGLGSLGVNIAKRYIPEDQKQYVECIDFKELRKGLNVLKEYKGLRLVEVKAQDGTEVRIII